MAAMGVSVCGIMMMMMVMGAAAQAPAPSVDCTTEVLTLSDCLTFVTGGEKTPPAACCTELKTVIDSSPQCLCLLFNTTFTAPLGVNVTLAQQLPPLCKVQTPPTSLCALIGIPVPGPVSSSSPVAPSPASTKTPTKAPASAPVAASPTSSSPSPTSAPAGSSPASAPSSVTAPTGSSPASSPPPSTSTVTPSPNSAPSITSQNAAVAASLLFLASIFLS